MHKKIFYFLTGIAFATGAISADAQDSVASIPEGMITFNIQNGSTSYLSLPLTNDTVYTGAVTAVTDSSISVGDLPAPFTTSLAAPGLPYFVKFLSGSEMGRVLLVTANTTSSLTLDTTDHTSGSPVFLTTPAFAVEVGDTFEIFPGDTLASVFGAASAQNPLLLTGAPHEGNADTISIITESGTPTLTYYYNTTAGYWEQQGTTVSANNVIIYPYSALTIRVRSNHPDATLVLSGRVTPVQAQTKVVGNRTVYTSTHYAADVALSQLQFGSNWVTGASAGSADKLSVWNAARNNFDTYYQKPDSTWRKTSDANTDASGFTIAAGSVTTITKRNIVSGAGTFLQSPLPYSLE